MISKYREVVSVETDFIEYEMEIGNGVTACILKFQNKATIQNTTMRTSHDSWHYTNVQVKFKPRIDNLLVGR